MSKITIEVEDTNLISDGYHTFGELYEHRIILWIAFCKQFLMRPFNPVQLVWRSKVHNDGTSYDGWFLLGMETSKGQITYHLPEKYWEQCDFATDCFKAPPFDGHTPEDVLERIANL